MSTAPNAHPPVLQPPGKGLPPLELFFARILVGWQARRTTRSEADRIFRFERAEILRLARELSEEQGRKQVLIKRLPGLEDSSRYWSVYMTVEHLRIVNTGMQGIILSLLRGQLPPKVVRTADVKPAPTVGPEVLEQFDQVCAEYESAVHSLPDLKSQLTWAHPWFGELNAERWNFFSGFHMALHRKQILAIRRALGV